MVRLCLIHEPLRLARPTTISHGRQWNHILQRWFHGRDVQACTECELRAVLERLCISEAIEFMAIDGSSCSPLAAAHTEMQPCLIKSAGVFWETSCILCFPQTGTHGVCLQPVARVVASSPRVALVWHTPYRVIRTSVFPAWCSICAGIIWVQIA